MKWINTACLSSALLIVLVLATFACSTTNIKREIASAVDEGTDQDIVVTALTDRERQNVKYWRARLAKAGFVNFADVRSAVPDKALCKRQIESSMGRSSYECNLTRKATVSSCIGADILYHRDGTLCSMCVASGKGLPGWGSDGGKNDTADHTIGVCRTRQNEFIELAADAYKEKPPADKMNEMAIYGDPGFNKRKFIACTAYGPLYTNVDLLVEEAAQLYGSSGPFKCEDGSLAMNSETLKKVSQIASLQVDRGSQTIGARSEAQKLIENFLRSVTDLEQTALARKILSRIAHIKFLLAPPTDSSCEVGTLAYVKRFGPFISKNIVICPGVSSVPLDSASEVLVHELVHSVGVGDECIATRFQFAVKAAAGLSHLPNVVYARACGLE